MMNRPIDATVITARLKRTTLGERIYDNVVLRRRDGSDINIGRVAAASGMRDVLVPGNRGRFHFHDVMGAQSLHAFAPSGGEVRIAFPMLLERVFALLAAINIILVSAWLAYDYLLPIVPLIVGVAATAAWATCRGCREAVLHDLKYEARSDAARSHRRAVMHGHA